VAALLARSSFPPVGTDITCAVSGGADSSALLVLAVAAGCRVEAVHVDHGLRPGGGPEAARVAGLAARLGARFRSESVHVAPGGNLEARARHARYAALPAGVLTGHTADDQAETVLVNLLRGAALDGLGGMRAGPSRPLLALRRAETRALCEHLGLDVLDDPTNRDSRHLRNRVRHELLPLLADLSGRDPVPLLCRQAGHLRTASDQLRLLAGALDPEDAHTLASAPAALAEVAVREWLRSLSPHRHPPDTATVARVLDVARGHARATDVGGGTRVRRSGGRLRIVPPPATDLGPSGASRQADAPNE
jgi:tRNA(Ile)-lysidine synthase